jgi:hypothetical protein
VNKSFNSDAPQPKGGASRYLILGFVSKIRVEDPPLEGFYSKIIATARYNDFIQSRVDLVA